MQQPSQRHELVEVGCQASRLFFALWPDDGVRAALAQAASKAARSSGGRPLPVGNWHSTLAFLGSVEHERVPAVAEAAASFRFAPFQLRFDRIEHWVKPALLCIVASEVAPAAADLARSLQQELLRRRFAPDLKPWRPHVTLARKVIKPHASGPIEPVEWNVRNFALVDSETLQEGPRYTLLEHWPK